jgi:hypothetical protein
VRKKIVDSIAHAPEGLSRADLARRYEHRPGWRHGAQRQR